MKEPKEPIEEETEGFNDAYDVIKSAIQVKSEHDTLNSDYVIANLTQDIFNNNVIIYITNHLNIMVGVNNYLSIEGDEEYLIKSRKLLLDEITTIVNLSRADNGKVLLAILDYIRGQGNQVQTPNTEETMKKGILATAKEKIGL